MYLNCPPGATFFTYILHNLLVFNNLSTISVFSVMYVHPGSFIPPLWLFLRMYHFFSQLQGFGTMGSFSLLKSNNGGCWSQYRLLSPRRQCNCDFWLYKLNWFDLSKLKGPLTSSSGFKWHQCLLWRLHGVLGGSQGRTINRFYVKNASRG